MDGKSPVPIYGRIRFVRVNVSLFPEDDVYFPDMSKLNEYILNDSGAIFNGDSKYIDKKPWFYGQVVIDHQLRSISSNASLTLDDTSYRYIR